MEKEERAGCIVEYSGCIIAPVVLRRTSEDRPAAEPDITLLTVPVAQ